MAKATLFEEIKRPLTPWYSEGSTYPGASSLDIPRGLVALLKMNEVVMSNPF